MKPRLLERTQRTNKSLLAEFDQEPPKFIVDSQKIHYPYYDHSVFDLWPRWSDADRSQLFLWYLPRQRGEGTEFFEPAEWDNFHLQYCRWVEAHTFKALTHPMRQGGPIDPGPARQLAQLEADRHKAMLPLREFIIENYQPIYPSDYPMFIFQYKGGLGRD